MRASIVLLPLRSVCTIRAVQEPQLDGPIRLPLSVGIGALESWCRAILGLGTIAVLVGFITWVEAQNARRALERGGV